MRSILGRHATEGETEDHSFIRTISLVHALTADLYQRDSGSGDGPTMAGMPAGLAMEIIQNELFYRTDDPLALLHRHYMLWTTFANQITTTSPRKPPDELLFEATGLEILDWIGFGFAFWSHRQANAGPGPAWIPKSYLAEADPQGLDTFLKHVSASAEDFAEEFGGDVGNWSFLPFQQQPLIENSGDYLILDETFLLERITRGLFWDVHDYESAERGDDSRRLWTQTHGEMPELYAVDLVSRLAPVVFGGGTSMYTEKDFIEAYDGKVCDAAIDLGNDFCLVEVVSGQVTTGTRIAGDPAHFSRDTEKIVIKKARQLDEACASVLDDQSALTGRNPPEGRRVFPIIVNIGTYPVNPVSIAYVEELLREELLLQDPRVQPLAIIDISELEMLVGWSSSGGPVMPEAVRTWKTSSLSRMSLFNHAHATYPEAEELMSRPAFLSDATDALFESVIDKLGLRGEADDE